MTMDIGNAIMTTIIDDGLLESNLENRISKIDFEKFTVFDIDSIDATIEDPGYILDEDTFNGNEEYTTSSYKKQSFVLPVTFFDISRNIRLLKKCRPISIKIVDCDIYPWYYKEIKHMTKNNYSVSSNQDEDLAYDTNADSTSHKNLSSYDTYVIDLDSPPLTPLTSFPKISLSPEQRSIVLKLKEEINSQLYVSEINENIAANICNEKATLKTEDDQPTLSNTHTECNFEKSVKPEDLLTYKAIAQTIVRNIDQNEASTQTDYRNININMTNDHGNVKNLDSSKEKHTTKGQEKIITSPILPYGVKPKKKSKPRITQSLKRKNVPEKRSNFVNDYNKFKSPINQKIPHYGSVSILQNSNNYFHLPNVAANSSIMPSEARPLYQPIDKNDCLLHRNPFLPYIPQQKLLSSPNNIEDMSHLGFHQDLCDSAFINNWQVTKEQFNENFHSNVNMPITTGQLQYSNSVYYQYKNQVSSIPGYQTPAEFRKDNSLRSVRRTNVNQCSNDEFRVFAQNSSRNIYNNHIPNSMCLINEYVNYSTTVVSQKGNVTQRNPILSQLLNCNKFSTRDHQPALEHQAQFEPREAMERTHHCLMGQNNMLPPGPLPPFESYLPSMQFSHDSRFHYPNAGTQLQSFSNFANTDSLQYKTNPNLRHLEINQDELTKGYLNNNIVSVDAPNVTISEFTRNNSWNRNVYAHKDIPKVVSSESYRNTNPNFIDVNPKNYIQNIENVVTKATGIRNIKSPSNDEINAMIKVLNNKKPKCRYSKVHKCNTATENQKALLMKNSSNSLKQPELLATYESGTISVVDTALVPDNTILNTQKENIAVTIPAQTRTNGYSPPILPIPTFKKSLELLSELQQSPALPALNDVPHSLQIETHSIQDISKQKRELLEFTNITRKRKLNNDEKVYNTSCTRISLEEYKFK